MSWTDAFATRVAALAVDSLIQEASLTPKPGLVDGRGSGAHADLDLDLMHRSARSLFPAFKEMARSVAGEAPSQSVRERLAMIGRDGERAMFEATCGVNTHKGAIWALGLLVAGAVMCPFASDLRAIAGHAGRIARHPDRPMPTAATNGSRAGQRYGVSGARGEAQNGFPHVVEIGLPALREARSRGVAETFARLDALLAIMAELDDTCLLHRGGDLALDTAKQGAAAVLRLGGTTTALGMAALHRLDGELLSLNASPGGAGDLLAATLFLDSLINPSTETSVEFAQHGEFQPWKY
jgi:triphosphoribosyl-dephospho-CoA synthase